MLYATGNNIYDYSGHVGDKALAVNLKKYHKELTEIQADGDELEVCCKLLGRELPPVRVYSFLGDNAKEIARNWPTN